MQLDAEEEGGRGSRRMVDYMRATRQRAWRRAVNKQAGCWYESAKSIV